MGGFRKREEHYVTIDDPVQQESDAKTESNVIGVFLASGHSTRQLSCGRDEDPDDYPQLSLVKHHRDPVWPAVVIVTIARILVRRTASVQFAVNLGHWSGDGVCDTNKNPELSKTDGSDKPIPHSFLAHQVGPMSVKVSLSEPIWSVLEKDEHADKDPAKTWCIRVKFVRYRKADLHHDDRVALHDAVVNFVFPQAREYVGKRLKQETDLSWVTPQWLKNPLLEWKREHAVDSL